MANTSSVTGGFRLVPLEIPLFNEFLEKTKNSFELNWGSKEKHHPQFCEFFFVGFYVKTFSRKFVAPRKGPVLSIVESPHLYGSGGIYPPSVTPVCNTLRELGLNLQYIRPGPNIENQIKGDKIASLRDSEPKQLTQDSECLVPGSVFRRLKKDAILS